MTIIREPVFEDLPKNGGESFLRHMAELFISVGRGTLLIAESFFLFPSAVTRSGGFHSFVGQLYVVGIRTLPVVSVVAIFTGMIFSLQVGIELARFNQEIYTGAAVMITLVREMGPFVTGICLSACVGSAMAAELGTMVVNDEIAALEIMAVSPVRFLASPRIVALTVMSPLLSFYTCVLGVIGGGVVAYTQLNVDFGQYMTSAMSMAAEKDLFVGILKAAVFGVLIGGVSCYEGFSARLGAVGVGRATQRSVVISFLLILMVGYMVTRMFY